MRSLPILLAVVLNLAALPLAAQEHRKRSPIGPTPHLNGKPDLSDIWEAERTPVAEFIASSASASPPTRWISMTSPKNPSAFSGA